METLNKTDWHDEALQLPLEELSRIYKRLKNKRTVITSIPIFFSVFVLIGYCIAGYGAYAAGRPSSHLPCRRRHGDCG